MGPRWVQSRSSSRLRGGSHGGGKWSAEGRGWWRGRSRRGHPAPVSAGNPTSAAAARFSDRHTEARGEPRIPLAKIAL